MRWTPTGLQLGWLISLSLYFLILRLATSTLASTTIRMDSLCVHCGIRPKYKKGTKTVDYCSRACTDAAIAALQSNFKQAQGSFCTVMGCSAPVSADSTFCKMHMNIMNIPVTCYGNGISPRGEIIAKQARTVSNINSRAPDDKMSVQQAPQGFDQRWRGGYGPAGAPGDPGPKPNFDRLNMRSRSKEKDTVIEHRQRARDKFDKHYVAQAQPDGQQRAARVSNIGQYSQGVSPIMNSYDLLHPSPQQPQVSPALFGQALPQMVPVQTVGGVMSMGIPVGHISQHPALFNQMQPGVSPQPSPLMYAQQIPAEQPRRIHNINEVVNPAQYQAPLGSSYATPDSKTFITSGVLPSKPYVVNINSYTTKQSGRPLSGYAVSADPSQRAPSSSTNAYSGVASSGSSGELTPAGMASYQAEQSPPIVYTETSSTVGLEQATGPAGFGNRPNHVRTSSRQTNMDQVHTSDSGRGGGDKVPVTMRRPNPRMQVRYFPPTIISFDLNSEHREPAPLRFGRFVYDRDVTHEEWEGFTKQLLSAWSERDPGFNRYHSAARRINAILSAWNYAFFNPRGIDIVLFRGNERRSGARYGETELKLEFLEAAGPVSDAEDESSDEEDNDSANPAYYLQQQDPDYRTRVEREKVALKAYRREEKRREAATRPPEAPHSLVVYEVPMPGESYR